MKNHIYFHTTNANVYREQVELWCSRWRNGFRQWQVWENGRQVARALTRSQVREFVTRYQGGSWAKGAL